MAACMPSETLDVARCRAIKLYAVHASLESSASVGALQLLRYATHRRHSRSQFAVFKWCSVAIVARRNRSRPHTILLLMKGHSHPNRDAQLLRTVGKVTFALTMAYLAFVGSRAWLRPSQAVTPVVDLDWIRSSHEVCS